jgi:hypothetical protein
VQQDKSEIEHRDCYNQRIGSHEVSIRIKRLSTVRLHQLEITRQMHYKKEDEKQAGEGHKEFSPECTGEKI